MTHQVPNTLPTPAVGLECEYPIQLLGADGSALGHPPAAPFVSWLQQCQRLEYPPPERSWRPSEFGVFGRAYPENLWLPELSGYLGLDSRWIADEALLRDAFVGAAARGFSRQQLGGQRTLAVYKNCGSPAEPLSFNAGCHLNVVVSRDAWLAWFGFGHGGDRYYDLYRVLLPACIAAASVLGGEGFLTGEEGLRTWHRSLAFEPWQPIIGPGTTDGFRSFLTYRPEHHGQHARLHLIPFDGLRLREALRLTVGFAQLVVYGLELGRLQLDLELANPWLAARALPSLRVGGDDEPALPQKAELVRGPHFTAAELLRTVLEALELSVLPEVDEELVPGAHRIASALWSCLDDLEQDPWRLVGRLQWMTVYYVWQQIAQSEGFTLERLSLDEILLLQSAWLDFTRLDGSQTWSSLVEHGLISEVTLEQDVLAPRGDPQTSSWFRAEVGRRFAERIVYEDWSELRFSLKGGRHCCLHLDDPVGVTRAVAEPCLAGARSVEDFLERAAQLPGVRLSEHRNTWSGLWTPRAGLPAISGDSRLRQLRLLPGRDSLSSLSNPFRSIHDSGGKDDEPEL
jgi:hypothetical protein